MKKNILLLVFFLINVFNSGFSNFDQAHLSSNEYKRHFTANGDLNFDVTDNHNLLIFLRFNLQGKECLSLETTLCGKDSFPNPFVK